ncbi:MAG: GH39 family glycosyl hydrolase [Phycisphaerae bacterium]
MTELFRRSAFVLAVLVLSVLSVDALAAEDSEGQVALTVEVDCSKPVHKMANFWNRFGFSPAWDLFKDHYQVYMAYAGSVPHEGLNYARIHRTLNLIGAQRDGNAIVYDWSKLDAATDILLRYGLKHHFEFDYKGSGSKLVDNRRGARSLEEAKHHRAVTRAIAEHFVKRHGLDEVATWWWESPNEGQLKWNKAGVGYWDAVTKGLGDVDPRFARKFGGPAAIYRKNPYDFVKLLENTENIFTGKKEHTVGFVSGHIKAEATQMVDREIGMIKKIRKDFPAYKDVPFVNTEHDPWNGWNNAHDWAGGPKFAAWTANAIYQEQLRIIEGIGQPFFCSNDSGFLSESWDRRTQMILFRRKDRFALIKKPAHTVFTLLAKLGDGRLGVTGNPDVRSGVGVLATRNSDANGQVAVLVFNDGQSNHKVTIQLRDLPAETLMLSHLRHDENTSNPYRVWPNTKTPTKDALAKLRREMELAYATPPRKVSALGGKLTLDVDMPTDSVSLFLLTSKGKKGPDAPGPLRVDVFPGLFGPEHLLTWKGSAEYGLRTYEVQRSPDKDGPWKRVDTPSLLCNSCMLPGDPDGGYYRIRAVDVWGRSGFGEPVAVPVDQE